MSLLYSRSSINILRTTQYKQIWHFLYGLGGKGTSIFIFYPYYLIINIGQNHKDSYLYLKPSSSDILTFKYLTGSNLTMPTVSQETVYLLINKYMYKTINFDDFLDSFSDTYKNNFTYEGKRALFDYLEALEEDIGEKIELDIVALCCEYSEYDSAIEAASNYFEFEGMTYGEDGGELETAEDVENKALKFLEDRTTVIQCEKGGVIIQQF